MTEHAPGGVGTHLALLLNTFLVSTSFPVGAAITGALEPAALNCVRFGMAAAVFAVLVTLRGEWRRPRLRDGLRYLLLAGSLVGFFVAMFAALRLTSAINTSSLFTLVPLFSVAIALPLLGQRTPPRQLAFMLLAAFGALWVVFKGSLANALALSFGEGDLIFIAGCASLAAFSPLTRRLDVGENLLSQTFWTLLVGTAMLAVIGAGDLASTDWRAVPRVAWSGIAYLAVFTTAVTFYLMKYASLRLPAAKVMSYSYLTPSFVVLLEAIRIGGLPAPTILIGAGITALATLFLQLSATTPRQPS
ncbi:MAG: DMT family transporter [Alphaproteobacteria bacterium]|nr:DMT family transporter [Alphaproteobacteria bacterium]